MGATGRLRTARLLWAARRGAQPAVDELWRRWLEDGAGPESARIRHALVRAGRPASAEPLRGLSRVALGERGADLAEALAESARRHLHPVAEAARSAILADPVPEVVDAVCEAALADEDRRVGSLTAWCARHGLVPSDPVRRGVFLLLTRRPEDRRAADPDGSLLALAYEAAGERERARIRTAVIGDGDLDLLRIVMDRSTRLSGEEIGHVTGQYARHGRWDDLWRLVATLPLVHAVEAMRLFTGGGAEAAAWRPRDADLEVFGALARLTPQAAAEGLRALASVGALELSVPGRIAEVSIDPSGRRLAVSSREDGDGPGHLHVFDLTARGNRLLHKRLDRCHPATLVHTGDALFAAAWQGRADAVRGRGITRYEDDMREVVLRGLEGTVPAMAALGDGRFAALEVSGAPGGEALARVLYFDGSGGARGGFPLYTELFWNTPLQEGAAPYRMAAEPRTGRLVLDGPRLQIIGTRPYARLARSEAVQGEHEVCFLGPDRIVAVSAATSRVESMRVVPGGGLETEASAALEPLSGRRHPVSIRGRGELAVLEPGRHERPAQVCYLDAATLGPAGGVRELDGRTGDALWGSPDGAVHALTAGGDIAVADAPHAVDVAIMARRWPGELGSRDLRRIELVRGDPATAAARPLAEVLWLRLEHRLATEIHISAVPPGPGGDDDIALGTREGTR
ncbi:hypothetical protein [Actinomadura rugatobispora]|uniref:LigA protein n=1 Tax=Actinomadura rugatobispora TaxID=1994 RepID=A0ABW1AGM0_9ACTN|nr:hypothetical protein GCM10010200_085450 [Actinomadura rugatobispora]